MVYPRLPPVPFVDAFQANVTLLPVVAVTWKLPGVVGAVVGSFLRLARAGTESIATAIPSATILETMLRFMSLRTLARYLTVSGVNIIDSPFGSVLIQL